MSAATNYNMIQNKAKKTKKQRKDNKLNTRQDMEEASFSNQTYPKALTFLKNSIKLIQKYSKSNFHVANKQIWEKLWYLDISLPCFHLGKKKKNYHISITKVHKEWKTMASYKLKESSKATKETDSLIWRKG